MAKANETATKEVVEELKAVDTTELDNAKEELANANLEKEALLKQIEELKAEKEKIVKEAVKKGAAKKGSFMVYTPVKNFNGNVAGVQFAYGKANVQSGWVLEWFKEKGYKVEEVK